jgi:hypothetical protein
LGTALDFTSADGSAPWDYSDWATTAAGAWLAAHAWEYGFINSYPRAGSPSLTCYQYEPWHYRYFSRTQAAIMHDSGLTSRQWLWANGGANILPSPPPTLPLSVSPLAATQKPTVTPGSTSSPLVAPRPSMSPTASPSSGAGAGQFLDGDGVQWLVILVFIGLIAGITVFLLFYKLRFFL